MNSIKKINTISAGRSVYADDILEFHASRILLLIFHCGIKKKDNSGIIIEGLTKLAKLDFFIRYPKFFEIVADRLKKQVKANRRDIESKMIRFHYGPWDERYYQLLPYLEAKNLITIVKVGAMYELNLTALGLNISKTLSDNYKFEPLVKDMKNVKKVLGSYSGNKLKELVYEVFGDEVTIKKLKDSIGYE